MTQIQQKANESLAGVLLRAARKVRIHDIVQVIPFAGHLPASEWRRVRQEPDGTIWTRVAR